MEHPSVSASAPLTWAHLRPPRRLSHAIRAAERAAFRIPREELSPAGAWVEDHARFLLGEADALHRALRPAPRLPGSGREPRVLLLAREICQAGQGEVTAPLILRTARTFLAEEEITQAELHLLPAALSCALFERLTAVLNACRQEEKLRAQAGKWVRRLKDGRAQELPKDARLVEKIISLLSAAEDAQGLRQADALLSREGSHADRAASSAHEEMTRMGQEAGRVILSLRRLNRLPFDRIGERLNPVAQILRQEATYRAMDAESRGFYQHRVAHLSRLLHVRETAVARAALALTQGQSGAAGEAGYYLIERPELIAAYLLKRRKRAPRHRQGLFVLPLYIGAVAFLVAGIALGAPVYLWPLLPLCGSEILRAVYFPLLRRHFPARMLPRLKLRRLSRETRTLVVVPTLLASRKQALHMARQLSVLRCANPDPYLDYMLLADFADNPDQARPEDEEILLTAQMAVEALNQSEGGGYFYLHRARAWDEGQRAFTGRERKRGALESLNRLLTTGETDDEFVYASCDVKTLKDRYAYVITLDADTFLPPGAAHKLIGSMLHPLQRGRVGVIQPRMELAADTVRTRTQLFLGGRGGVDAYNLAVQDIYQDLFGRGSFVGKGIYEPRLWLERLNGRIPAGRLLSHDLIEGEIAVGALAPDIVLYDGHPARLAGWHKRLHRWTRGDWQLLPFLRDRRLSLLSRHKIWDNLRRSLAPAAQTILLLSGAGLGNPLLCLLGLPWPCRGMGKRLLLLPAKAVTQLDGAARAIYRQFVSHRGLLSWVTAAQAEGGAHPPLSCVLAQALGGTAMIVLSLLPMGFLPAVFIGLAWAVSPLFSPFLDAPIRGERGFTPAQRASVRALARETWRFFEDSVTEQTLFLPPDNVQLDPDKGPALRTSPTNIGLYLLSCAAARELGFLTTAEMARRFRETLRTLESLKTWRGHLYNWYDLNDGEPLPPAFVSTVDSGNLAGCLMACAQICRMRLAEMEEQDRALPARFDALFARMDFSALYDREERLFFVGWDVAAQRPTPAHYDLMASEARLASFIAVMTGQAPLEHWARLSRAVARAGGGPALLSWGGTMFEYLMPTLLLPLTPGTLIGEGCLNAVRAQMSDHPRRPFGISECGYYAFDPDLNYQYKAFGLPGLALSGETAGSVVTPYASMLALPFFPRAAGENLRRMRRLHWADEHGLFEAADYSPQRVGRPPRLVRSHMAHHQGMILCAACNTLEDNALVRAFMAPPPARAYAYLLLERAPRRAPRRPNLPPPREDAHYPGALSRAPRTGLPVDAQALAGGGMTWLLSAHGQGYLSENGVMLTRFSGEAGEQSGPQFYLREDKTGALLRPAVQGACRFEAGSARFFAGWEGLSVTLQCCVSPLSSTAVAALMLENPGREEREVEAVSFLEIAQSPQAADAAHPNFRDLSVRVSEWGGNGLLSRRLPRDGKDEMPLILHAVVGDVAALRRQGDRTLFLGRLGSYAAPAQMGRPAGECAFRTGDVAAPCLSLRARLRVPGGGKAAVFFLTAAKKKEEELSALALSPEHARAAFSLAATQAKMALRFLGIDGRMLAYYQQILGAVAFFGQPHQALLPSAPRNALWRARVAGVLPLLLIRVEEGADRALIRHALRTHAWMRMQGIWVDCVFFCREGAMYQRPARDTVVQLIAASPARDLLGVDGGVHVVSGTMEEAREMESLSRLTLRGNMPLGAQLSALRCPAPNAPAQRLALPAPVAPPALTKDNSFGGFSEEGAYCVYAPSPAPWHNLLCGPGFGTLVCETGVLHSYAGNSRLGRVTRLCPDVHRAPASEEIYLRDETGAIYPLARCTAAHEPGATTYRTLNGSVYADLTLFSHPKLPLGVRSLTLRGDRGQKLRLFYLVRFALGEHPETTRCQSAGDFALARSGDLPGVGWARMPGGRAQALSPAVCFGLKGDEAPPALLSPVQGPGSVAFFTQDLTLRAHEPLSVALTLGFSPDEEQARRADAEVRGEGAGAALRAVRAYWAGRLSNLTLFSGDGILDQMMNLWLPYQARAARLMARMGPYQAGGAFGFRDQLQDLLILLHTEPEIAREHILLCAAHQFPEGDVQHWWHAPRRGVRTRISDDKLFLPYMTARYVKITGDENILSATAPYLSAPPLSAGEDDRYDEPAPTPWEEPLLAHCLRAIHSVALGGHDLPLMGGGDWNDGMNRVGGMRGESVWLGFFLALTLREFAPLCPTEERERLDQLRRQVMAGAENAWTGKWYLRAWYDSGEPLGGPDTDPPRIDLISQSFAALAGAPRDHARTALIYAVEKLYDREAGIVKLLDPPFTPEEQAGYIGAYLPGIRENGGQYTHAAPWLVMALCKLGEYRLAWEIARALLPVSHGDTRDKALTYRVEPYVLAGDVYAGENLGRGGWSWYTGSAAWLYFVFLTVLMGFDKRGDRARLSPCPEPGMEEYTLIYRFGDASYHFTAARDTVFATLDGEKLPDGWVTMRSDGRTHEARYPLPMKVR